MNCMHKLDVMTLIFSNKLSIYHYWMQASRGNILKRTGMLCNPNFI